MKGKQIVTPHSIHSSLASELDILDPLVERANLPPTQGQFEVAHKLGIDIQGKNPGSASIRIAQALRDLAQKLIKEHRYAPGMQCMLDGKNPVIIQKVNNAKGYFATNGAQVYVKSLTPPKQVRWVHPSRLGPIP